MNFDKNTERIDEARVRAAALASLIDLGVDVDVEDIQRAALIELSPAAVQAVFNVAHLTLVQMDTLAAILAGACSSERIMFFATLRPSALKAPARRPRRPRPRPRPTCDRVVGHLGLGPRGRPRARTVPRWRGP